VLDATFVKVETDAGLTGWGEGTPWGHTYVPAHGPGIRAGLETMAPAILGQDPRKVELIERAMDVCLPGHLYAKQPIDLACWDIMGKAYNLSIADLLGGKRDTGTPAASSVSSGEPDYMMGIINSYRDIGYVAHSAKVGGSDTAKDIERIRHIESNRRANEIILYDVNRAWTRREASIVMNAVADLGVTFEQPGETLDDIAQIRKVTTSPISVDESLVTLQDATRRTWYSNVRHGNRRFGNSGSGSRSLRAVNTRCIYTSLLVMSGYADPRHRPRKRCALRRRIYHSR